MHATDALQFTNSHAKAVQRQLGTYRRVRMGSDLPIVLQKQDRIAANVDLTISVFSIRTAHYVDLARHALKCLLIGD